MPTSKQLGQFAGIVIITLQRPHPVLACDRIVAAPLNPFGAPSAVERLKLSMYSSEDVGWLG